MRSVAALLIFAASALAYSITTPTNNSRMATNAPISVTWTKVSTDPDYFDMVLSNQQRNPPTQQVLATHVDGSKGSMAVNPPNGGWVPAPGYQVNFVKDGGILAQSGQFIITKN